MSSLRKPAHAPAALLERLGVDLDPELLVLALTHRSFAHEAGGIPTNERLEFLGDTVLGLVVTEELYRRLPDNSEGDLAKMRAATVSQRALAEVARTLDLGAFVLLGKGELHTGGRDKDSILSDTVEALLGAVYLAHGLETSRALVLRLVGPTLRAAADLGAGLDWKTSLQELAAARSLGAPYYDVSGEGPDHARVFTARVLFADEEYGRGTGAAKKIAEQQAAEMAYRALSSSAQAGQASSASVSDSDAPDSDAPGGDAVDGDVVGVGVDGGLTTAGPADS